MSPRRARFARLADVRKQQYERAVLQLQIVRSALHSAQDELATHQRHGHESRTGRDTSLACADHREWMLSCAAAELHSLHAMHAQQQCVEAHAAVKLEEAEEQRARRELRQTERMLETICADENAVHALREQKQMDEIAAVLKARLSKRASALGLLT